jgi:hypothetical protein
VVHFDYQLPHRIDRRFTLVLLLGHCASARGISRGKSRQWRWEGDKRGKEQGIDTLIYRR